MERQICSKDRPRPEGAEGQWAHPEAKYVGEEYGGYGDSGDYDIFECPHCRLVFKVTVPD